MNLEELTNKVKNGDYKEKLEMPKVPIGYDDENYIYHQNSTKAVNTAIRTRLVNNYEMDMNKYEKENESLIMKFYNDLIEAVREETGLELLKAQEIVNKFYKEGAEENYNELEKIELAKFTIGILNIKNRR